MGLKRRRGEEEKRRRGEEETNAAGVGTLMPLWLEADHAVKSSEANLIVLIQISLTLSTGLSL